MPSLYSRVIKALVLTTLIACDHSKPAGSRRTSSTLNDGLANSGTDTQSEAITADSPPDTMATEVVRRYFDAIQKREYDTAYSLWGLSGQSSGQPFREFEIGFAETGRTNVSIGQAVDAGVAAGSQFVTVPVKINATLHSGAHQHFTGTYTLRRAIADGATPAQRSWHIYGTALRQLPK